MQFLFDPDDVFRPPDWRWTYASLLSESQTGNRALGDNAVRRAWRYHKLIRDSENGKFIAMTRMGDIARAHKIWVQMDQRVRWSIEARVLADESPQEIAAKSGASEALIELYELLFFDVRPRLNHPDYIVHCVMGPIAQLGLSEREYDLLWKLYGYFGGPDVLDAVMYRFRRRRVDQRDPLPEQYLAADASQALLVKAAIAAHTVPINGFTASEILTVYVRFLEMERKADGSTQSRSELADNIEEALFSLPWTTGRRAKLELTSPAVLEMDERQGELTSAELLLVHAGESVDVVDESVFPS